MSKRKDQLSRVRQGRGFIAALDQSGGSTAKALERYGIGRDAYSTDDEMFALVHQMRSRIISSPSFGGERILGAILFEDTLARSIADKSSSRFLWEKNIVPFLKVDSGLVDEADGVQMMKPISNLSELLEKAKDQEVFGTKMRSVIKSANAVGIARLVAQQFEVGREILEAGLTPIIEPEVDIHATDKREAERILREELMTHLDRLGADERVMLKLTLPEEPNFYSSCRDHAKLLRLVALSGGYSREEANRRLAQNVGVIASFSRALTEGLSIQQSEEQFDTMLDLSIQLIFEASMAPLSPS